MQPQVAEHVGHDLAAEMAAQRLQIGPDIRCVELVGIEQLEQPGVGIEVRSQPVTDRALAALEHQPCQRGQGDEDAERRQHRLEQEVVEGRMKHDRGGEAGQ